MLEALDTKEVLLANGNWMKTDKDTTTSFLDSPSLDKVLQEHKELSKLEIQFAEMIMHVIEQIEKESEPVLSEKDLWPDVSLLDMKKYLKTDVSVTGVTDSSPIFVLESVYPKLGQVLHNFNMYEIGQLAACTKVELSHIIKQAPRTIPSYDFEFALEDAKSVMKILSVVEEHKAKEQHNALGAWNSWGNLTQVSNLLHIKENSQKIANFMGVIAPKHITASIMGTFTSQNHDDEDIDSFQTLWENVEAYRM